MVDEAGDVVAKADSIAGKLDLAGGGDLKDGDGLLIAGESEGAELEGGGDFFVSSVVERLGSLEESEGAFGEEILEEDLPGLPVVGVVEEGADFGGLGHGNGKTFDRRELGERAYVIDEGG